VTRRRARALVLAAWLGAPGCVVISDPSDLTEGCGEGSKACGGRCVTLSDPETGCGTDDCVPCVFANGVAICRDGACYLSTCREGFADCDEDGDDPQGTGCEVDVFHDPDHCGGCGEPCPNPDHAEAGCAGGDCSIDRCQEGWGDCDRSVANGCEVDLTRTAAHCGVCDRSCGDSQSCVEGACV